MEDLCHAEPETTHEVLLLVVAAVAVAVRGGREVRCGRWRDTGCRTREAGRGDAGGRTKISQLWMVLATVGDDDDDDKDDMDH